MVLLKNSYIFVISKQSKLNKMTTKFELRNWLSENREIVIAEYNSLTNDKFFNGISLKDFMVSVMKAMSMNNPKSEKRAASLLPNVMSRISADCSSIEAFDAVTARLAKRYEGTSGMALV